MFVVAMKTTRAHLAVWGIALVLLLAVTVGAGFNPAVATTTPVSVHPGVTLLRGLGYEVGDAWTDVREILLPTTMDAAMTAYNEMQQASGYDLTPCLGERVKYYTYAVAHHPEEEEAVAHLYEYDGRVVAGDVTFADGSCRGLTPAAEQGETNGTTG